MPSISEESPLKRDFYNILFDYEDRVCWSRDVYGTSTYPVVSWPEHETKNFFCINALKGSRADANVHTYRNFLIEFDSLSLLQQEEIGETIPYSTAVYSGGKSIHFIISLEEPCKSKSEYNDIMKRILRKLPDADKSAKNPSRLSRAPGAIRVQVPQKLINVKGRITRERLEKWLGPDESPKISHISNTPPVPRILKGSTSYFLFFGAPEGSWNKELFIAVIDLSRAHYTEQEIYSKLEAITGSLDRKDRRTIKSALDTVRREREE